jgi:hypothetical protein
MHPLGANRAYAFLGQLAAGRRPILHYPERGRKSGLKCPANLTDTVRVLVMNDKPGAALLDVRAAMATVFARECVDRLQTRLFTEDPRAVVKNTNGFVFIYPGIVYGVDKDGGVVWENLDVAGVDARRCFDFHGSDIEAEHARLRTRLER